MNKSPITTSFFDLFKVGPGPSSSHTIGPMKAAYDFLQRLQQLPGETLQAAEAIHIHLYGALAFQITKPQPGSSRDQHE